MTSRGITAIVIVVGGMLVALYIIVSVLTGFGNVIGATYKYFLPGAFIVGALAPRASMYLLVLSAVYIDLLKKLMAVDYNLYFVDLFFILGVPAVLLMGMCCGIFANVAQGRVPFDKRFLRLLFLAIFIVGVSSVASIAKTGANLATLKELSNSAAYYGLIFALPVLFPTLPDVFKLLRFFVLIMIPAAFHGLGHFLFGLMPFEEDYMISGLTVNLDFFLTGEGIFGPFASQGALAGSMTIAASLCALPFLVPRHMLRGLKFPKRWLCCLLILLFISAAVFSLKRFPVVVLPFTVIGYFLIKSRFGTAFAYFGAISSVVALVVLSETIANRLPEWQARIDEMVDRRSHTNKHLFRLQTLNTRLEDFSYLKRSENWEPFGAEWFREYDAGDYGVHSLVVKIFLRFGWVPISLAMLCLLPVAWFLHSRLLRRIRSLQQRLFVFSMSLSISIFLTAGLGAAFFGAFPIPLLFALFLSIAVGTGILPVPVRTAEVAPSRPERQAEPLRRPVPSRA